MTAAARVVDGMIREGDEFDRSLRPQTLDDFIGQRQARENLRVFVDAAKARA